MDRKLLEELRKWILNICVKHGFDFPMGLAERIDAALSGPEPDAIEVCVHCGNTKDNHYGDELLCAVMDGSPVFLAKGSAMEIAEKLLSICKGGIFDDEWKQQAAALIESHSKRVPKAMPDEIEARFEELENIIGNEVVRDMVSELKNLVSAKFGYRAE